MEFLLWALVGAVLTSASYRLGHHNGWMHAWREFRQVLEDWEHLGPGPRT